MLDSWDGRTVNTSPAAVKAYQARGGPVTVLDLLCVGGLLITAITYVIATRRGGYYVLASGAIVYGAVLLLCGLMQRSRVR